MIPDRNESDFIRQLKGIALATLYPDENSAEDDNLNEGDWTHTTVANISDGLDSFTFTATRYDDPDSDDPRLITFGGDAIYGQATLRIAWFIAKPSPVFAENRRIEMAYVGRRQ